MKDNKISTKAPLSGICVLVGRARHQASALSGGLQKQGATVLEIPFIEIHKPKSFKPLDFALQNLASYAWLVLTSVNGVEAMWDRMKKLRLTEKDLAHMRIAAIGPATKKAIEQRGGKVTVMPKEYVAESVVQSLKDEVQGKRLLLVRAKVARDVIPRELRAVGAHVDVVEAYETVVPQSSGTKLRTALKDRNRRPHIVTFTSSSTVKNFVTLLGNGSRVSPAELRGMRTASIGPVTSSTLRDLGLPVDIEATEFTIPGLIAAIVSAVDAGSHVR
jgi:uroporphyrinogen-III synthase